jgi:hypothetical protein
MASWKKVIVSGSAISALNNDANYLTSTAQSIVSSSAQLAADISGSGNVRFEALNTETGSLSTRIESLNTQTGSILGTQVIAGTGLTGGGTLAANRTLNVASANNGIVANADNIELATASSTFTDGVKAKLSAEGVISSSAQIDGDFLNTTGDNVLSGSAQIAADISGSLSAAAIVNLGANLVSGSAQVVALVEAGTDSNTFTDADHSKLNAIEASATADQTDAEIRAAVEAATDSNVFTDADHSKLNAIEASADVTDTTNVTAAGALMDSELTSIADVKALNQSLVTGASPTFVGLTLTGDLEVQGTTTTINSTTVDIGDNIVALNGTGAALGGLHINDANGPKSGSLLWDGTNNKWIGGQSGSEVDVAFLKGQGLLSGSGQIATDISGSFVSASNALGSRIDNITSTITLSADSGTNDTYTTGETLTFTGDNSITTTVSDNQIAISIANGVVSGSAQVVALVEAGTDSNTFTDADHSKLNAIEASADVTDTANVTAAGALMDSEVTDLAGIKGVTISTLQAKPSEGAFADGDKTKLDAIEASADVTDTTNVTAAGALMDSEVTALALIKGLTAAQISGSGDVRFEALNAATSSYATVLGSSIVSASVLSSPSQGTVRLATNGVNTDVDSGLQTGDSPTFASLTLTGDLNVNGTVTNINSTDLNIEDKFILLNSGSASGNSGIIAQNSSSNGEGTALFFDDTANRWSLDYAGANANTDVVAADARIAAVALANDDANYQKDGNIFVDGSGDVFIYVE